jgi:tetratricopeptide (TPR) repeat protein
VVAATAGVLFLTGRWDDALARYERARDLDPEFATTYSDLAQALMGLRRYAAAVHAAERSLALEPDQTRAYIQQVWTAWLWKGNLGTGRDLIERLPPSDDWRFMELRYLQRLFERDFRGALRVVSSWPGRWMRTFVLARPVALLEGQAHRLIGDAAAARRAFETARRLLEDEVRASPADGRLQASLAVTYAGLGRKADALDTARRALALMPYPSAFDTTVVREDVALAATMAGDHDQAFSELTALASTPSHFSVQLLRIDPRWDPLRADRRYPGLVALGR